jgi:hypothetical protein
MQILAKLKLQKVLHTEKIGGVMRVVNVVLRSLTMVIDIPFELDLLTANNLT